MSQYTTKMYNKKPQRRWGFWRKSLCLKLKAAASDYMGMNILSNFYNPELMPSRRSLYFRLAALVLPALYLFITFFRTVGCGQVGGCTLNDFTPVFPFYTLVLFFNGKLEFWSYIILYILSSAVYLVIFYQLGGWLERQYNRLLNKPKFILRRV